MQLDKNSSNPSPSQTNPSPKRKPGLLAKLKGNKPLLIVVIVVLVAGIGGAVFALTRKSDTKKNTTTNQSANTETPTPAQKANSMFMQQYGQNCKERDVKFTSAPMKTADLSYIRPLGAVSDGHVTPTDHVYVGGPNPNAADNTYPVLMPADGTVTEVSAMPAQYIGDRQGQQVAPEDHRLVISHSCRYFSIYIHIHKLSDALKAAVGDLQPSQGKQTSIELKAGDVIGYIGGSTFDWTPIDTSKTLAGFITPSRYDGESWKIHTVSPFDLYEGSLKAELEAKSLRTVAPLGGKIDYDEPGKLVGNWFREGTGGYSGPGENNGGRYWDGHLSVAPDYVDPAATIVSIGNWDGNAKQFVVSGSVDPSKITKDDGIVKYELKRLNYVNPNGGSSGLKPTKGLRPSQDDPVEGTIIFQVMPGEKLKVEKFIGKKASQVSAFTGAAQMYER